MRTMMKVALGIGALTAAGVAAAQVPPPPMAGTRLDIVAQGSVKRVPDVAVISAGVVTQNANAKAALSDNGARMARVLAALRRAGVAERDITTSQIGLQAQYRYADNQPPVITGYQATNSVSVKFRDIAKSGGILDILVGEGANQINGPTLTIDQPEAALDEARIAAMATARTRAALYAKAAGLRVKRIVSISESGGYAPPPPMPYVRMQAMDVASAKTEIAAGEQSVDVSVAVTFELE